MNPNKPDCISDEEKASSTLKESYSSLFNCFFQLTQLPSLKSSNSTSNTTSNSTSSSSSSSSSSNPKSNQPSEHKGGWANGLYMYLDYPERYPQNVFSYDKDCVTIYDKYPKVFFFSFFEKKN